MAQTAVEWLTNHILNCDFGTDKEWQNVFEQAKEMKKQQIINAYDKGQENPQIEVTNYFEPNTQFYETPF